MGTSFILTETETETRRNKMTQEKKTEMKERAISITKTIALYVVAFAVGGVLACVVKGGKK